MQEHAPARGSAVAAAPRFVLDRREAVPALIGRHEDFLIVTGLAGTARDVAALTRDGAHTFTMAGAMGGACMIGLGLALARRERRVLVVTGDGELLMNVGALATIAVMNPPNLAIVCVDNGHYGETGMQASHTKAGIDLVAVALGCRFKHARAISRIEEAAEVRKLLHAGEGPILVSARISEEDVPRVLPIRDGHAIKQRFIAALNRA